MKQDTLKLNVPVKFCREEQQVGTIVEELNENIFEVEFADAKGRTITSCALAATNLLKLTHELAI